MEQETMKKCPYCAEQIKAEAVKCRYCGSDLRSHGFNMDFFTTPGYWRRVNEGKRIAGVCTGIARQLDSPILILPLRLFFIMTTILWGFGLILYIVLWLLMSSPTDFPGAAEATAGSAGGPPDGGEPAQPQNAGEEDAQFEELTITDESGETEPEPEPDTTGNGEEEVKDTPAAEWRIMKPIACIAMIVIGLGLVLNMYMAMIESFISASFPVWLMALVLITVTGIMGITIREIVFRKQAGYLGNL